MRKYANCVKGNTYGVPVTEKRLFKKPLHGTSNIEPLYFGPLSVTKCYLRKLGDS